MENDFKQMLKDFPAIERKADVFITNDKQLKKVKEIAILYLGDYL